MQESTEEAEASIPTEPVPDGPPPSGGTVMSRRKAAKRSLPWDLAAGELNLLSPQPQVVNIPARKKQRLEEPFSASVASTDDAAAKTASPDVSVGLSAAADNADTRVKGHWTLKEDSKLKSAVTNTSKKKWGNEYKTDWAAVAALVPGRTRRQCWHRWKNGLDPSIDRVNGRTGKWAEDEDSKLKEAVQTHGGKNWCGIAALVPSRTRNQCRNRWNKHIALIVVQSRERTGTLEKAQALGLDPHSP
jgi:hypothetical protein